MGTILASALINKAQAALFDTNGVQWSRAELLSWLNDAQRQIVLRQPTANSLVTNMLTVAGARQTLPSTAWQLLDVYCNMGTAGTAPGRAVRLISKKLLDAHDPNWRAATKTAIAYNFLYDPQSQTSFWVYPPALGTGYLQVNYSKLPTDITAEATAIEISDIFAPAVVEYLLYKSYTKHVAFADNDAKARAHWTAFEQAVGAKSASEEDNDPNKSLDPKQPKAMGAES